MYAENVDFSGGKSPTVTANGQLLIGSAVSPNIRVGTLSSSDGSITWNVGAGTISGVISGGTTVGKTITGDSGGALPPSSGNWNLLGTGSITTSGAGSTLTTQLTGLTNHSVLVGAGTATITKVAPSATSGVPLISQGAAADPAFGTAVVAGGGTGQVTLTNHGVLVGAGTTAITQLSVGTNGQLLTGSTGADPVFATPTSTGGTFTTGAGSLLYTPANFTVGYSNFGIAYNAGTGVFTVQSASGAALSATNPGYVSFPSIATPGQFTTLAVTANQNFIDDTGASEIIGNLFGFTTGVAIAVDVPFYIYAVLNDAENAVQFMCGRTPHRTLSPTSANIGFPGTPGTNIQNAFFSFDTITTTQWDSNPCVVIGSFRMQMSASDDWTVQTLSTSDGVGRFNEGTSFTMPLGQFGANASTYTIPNGGTAPVFTTSTYTYFVKKNGTCNCACALGGDGGTDGSGAVEARVAIPFKPQGNIYTLNETIIAAATKTFASCLLTAGTNYATWALIGAVNTTWGAYTNGNRTVNIATLYPISLT